MSTVMIFCLECGELRVCRARRLCGRCYWRLLTDGVLEDKYPRVNGNSSDWVEEWEWLQPILPEPHEASQRARIALAAQRIGISFSALEKALYRTGTIGPRASVRPTLQPESERA